jgi:cell division protein FtsB
VEQPRARFTGRALVLLLVLAALVASYASSLRAYVDQRGHIGSLQAQIEDSREAIADLEREKKRWDDDAYVIAQARARFAFGFPGEIGYQVLDEEGRPLGHDDTLSEPEPVAEDRPEWWERTLDSVEVAGHPPREDAGPVERITTPPDLRSPSE